MLNCNFLKWPTYIVREEIGRNTKLFDKFSVIFVSIYYTARSLCGIPDFAKHRTLILDCWAIYHHINFQCKDYTVKFNYFPLWDNSEKVRFGSYSL